jgi:hypothetical protein
LPARQQRGSDFEVHFMRKQRLSLMAGLVAAVLTLLTSPAWAQSNTNNTNNTNNGGGLANAPAGVFISAAGVLSVKPFTDKTGELTKTRIAEQRVRLGNAVTKGSPLRKISLQRLEAAMAECLAGGKQPTDEMKALAGLTRLQYVFYYPDTKDIVIAGPAEGFFQDFSGRLIGMNSGRAVVELQDLAAALRAFPPGGKPTHTISVSIDPTPEGLANMQKWLASIRPGPGDAENIVEGLKRQLGLHNVTISGVSAQSHFAQVLVEADYRMKLIGIGIEPPPVKMATYIDKASAADVSRSALQRWFFTPNYDCVRVADDDMAMELVGQGVKLIGESELVAAGGQRSAGAGTNKASALYCQAFTANYPMIAQRNAVYGQLKNLIDVAVAAAFIQKEDYYGQSGWKAEVIGDEKQYPIEVYPVPKTVETACTAVWKGNRLMTPVGGGVQMEPTQAVKESMRLRDEKGTVKQAHDGIKLDNLAKNQWWWD